jgi:hypothetical protein
VEQVSLDLTHEEQSLPLSNTVSLEGKEGVVMNDGSPIATIVQNFRESYPEGEGVIMEEQDGLLYLDTADKEHIVEKTLDDEEKVSFEKGVGDISVLENSLLGETGMMIHVYIRSHLTIDELREIFLFFDPGYSYEFIVSGQDPMTHMPVYEMIFPTNSAF